MSVHIRLRRIGKNPKKHPHFRIAAYERTRNRDGRAIEPLGFYSSLTGEVKVNKERVNYWIKNGAQVSETVKSLIKKAR
ncbi:MAG: 30S ribosomal protein S16 [Candidatus Omnitrophota bacterium]